MAAGESSPVWVWWKTVCVRRATKYQATHHQFVAGAKATKLAHEIDAGMQIGMMLGDDAVIRHMRPEDVFAIRSGCRWHLYFFSVM